MLQLAESYLTLSDVLNSFSLLKYVGKTHYMVNALFKNWIVENQMRKKCAQNKTLNDCRDRRSLKHLNSGLFLIVKARVFSREQKDWGPEQWRKVCGLTSTDIPCSRLMGASG